MISVFSQNYSKGMLLYLLLISSMCLSDAVRAKRTSFIDDVTTIRTEYVGNNRTIWAMFNLTDEQMGRIRAGINASGKDQTNETRDSQIFDIIKRQRLEDIRTRIQSAFDAGNWEESQEQPQHQVAAYPICNTESNGGAWLSENNVTIKFANSVFEFKRDNLNLESAILRLYKLKPNGTVSPSIGEEQQQIPPETDGQLKLKRCADPIIESQIRVTVSLLQPVGRNKPRKKRICNTLMMNVSKTGWVEIDIKRAVLIWKSMSEQQAQHQQNRQAFGWLMIEVHDEEERPLKAGQYFKPPNCEQADVAIPWNYYGPESSMSSFETQQVPRYPRLDVRLSGYASFAPKNYNKTQNKKLHENIMRQLYNLSKNAAEIDNESTTSNSPTVDNLLESFESNKMLTHQHRKRHYQQQQEHQQAYEQREQINSSELTNESQQFQRQHRRRQRRHHHKHQHHHRNQHEQHEQQ